MASSRNNSGYPNEVKERMAVKKPSAAQIAARAKFLAMVKGKAGKKTAAPAPKGKRSVAKGARK